MNLTKLFLWRAPVVLALFAGFIPIPASHAQTAPQNNDSRYLLIFDTSAEMKKRLPAVQTEVNQLMATSLSGQLRPGNSLGVWTFDKDLHAGQFPLEHWNPDDAVAVASSINKFIGRQRYANGTRFTALQPQLDQVIQSSGRLTVLIFCDGEDEIKWTPYDDGINQIFQQRLAEQKKTRQPFVLVFRTQLGKYAGCTMNFPPGMVNVPEFPPLPAPLVPVSSQPAPPPPAPVIKPPIGAPLMIIGTKVVTNWPTATPPAPVTPTNPAPVIQSNPATIPSAETITPTNPVALGNMITPPAPTNPQPAIQSNPAPVPSANSSEPANSTPATPTNLVPIVRANQMPTTNAVAQSPENSDPAHKNAFVIGAVLLTVAVVLVVLAVFRGRRADRNSLITRSMRKD